MSLQFSLGTLHKVSCSPLMCFIRHGHRLRGKPPGIARTLAQRIAEEHPEDIELNKKVDIGFPFLQPSRSAELKQRLDVIKGQRKNEELEKLARTNKLAINLEETKKEWLRTAGPFHIRKIADHYGVFEHLFGKYAFFTPRINLDIKYKQPEETYCPVYYGNQIKPVEAKNAPEVNFDFNFNFGIKNKEANDDSLWTLVLTNPDGHLTEENKEYVHWMITNIPNNDISKGDQIVPYLQPIPPKGSGHHRHVFVLYKQDKKLDLNSLKITDTTDLTKRTFSTFDFYRDNQDDMTPAGLAFFQSDWDSSLTDVYHDKLNMKEPIYDYDFPEAYIRDQTYFPIKQAFNLYLDKYRDPKQVHKEHLERRLAKTHPFDGPEPPLRFPNAHSIKNVPSWLKTEMKKSRLGLGRINDV